MPIRLKLEAVGISELKDKILLIIPCFNEARRLNTIQFISKKPDNVTYLFADDGSSDETKKVIESISKTLNERGEESVYICHSPQNLGKANIIQFAYEFAVKQNILKKYEWVGFWDADLATPLTEINKLVQYRNIFAPQFSVIFASRINKLGSKIIRSKSRHYFSRVFLTVADLIVSLKSYDSQCGAKLLSKESAQRAFAKPFVSRWLFDIEIIKRIGEENIIEVPLQSWSEIAGSKMNVIKESFRLIFDLILIRIVYGKLSIKPNLDTQHEIKNKKAS